MKVLEQLPLPVLIPLAKANFLVNQRLGPLEARPLRPLANRATPLYFPRPRRNPPVYFKMPILPLELRHLHRVVSVSSDLWFLLYLLYLMVYSRSSKYLNKLRLTQHWRRCLRNIFAEGTTRRKLWLMCDMI